MFVIGKSFKYDGGHRIWNQNLNQHKGTELELCKTEEKCKCIHGHTVRIEACLQADALIDDMVLDFNYLKPFKNFVDTWFDHKLVIFQDDPLASFFAKNIKDVPQDVLNGIVITSFNPTAENLAKYFYGLLTQMLKGIPGIEVSNMKVYETETSYSMYIHTVPSTEKFWLLKLKDWNVQVTKEIKKVQKKKARKK